MAFLTSGVSEACSSGGDGAMRRNASACSSVLFTLKSRCLSPCQWLALDLFNVQNCYGMELFHSLRELLTLLASAVEEGAGSCLLFERDR